VLWPQRTAFLSNMVNLMDSETKGFFRLLKSKKHTTAGEGEELRFKRTLPHQINPRFIIKSEAELLFFSLAVESP